MIEHIERIRKKPNHVKTQYAFWGAMIATSFVVMVWSVTLPSQFASLTLPDMEDLSQVAGVPQVEQTATDNQSANPLTSLRNMFGALTDVASSTEERLFDTQRGGAAQQVPIRIEERAPAPVMIATSSYSENR